MLQLHLIIDRRYHSSENHIHSIDTTEGNYIEIININTTYCDNILSRSNYWLQLLGYHDYKIQSTCYIIIT